jgi:signal transduction histidine kinase
MARDIELELNIKKTYEDTINLFLEIQNDLNMDMDENELIELYIKELKRIIDYHSVAFVKFNEEKNLYVITKQKNYNKALKKNLLKILRENFLLWAGRMRKAFVLKEEVEEIKTSVIVPIVIQEKIVGAFILNTMYIEEYFTKNKLKVLEIVTSRISIAFENIILYRDLERRNQNLKALKNYMDNVVQNMNDGIIVLDSDEKIRVYNKKIEELINIKRKDVFGKKLIETNFDIEFIKKINRIIKKESSTYITEEIEYKIDEENTILFGIGVKPLKLEEENSGKLIVLRDLRESKELKELKRIDKLKDEFLSMVSHELRTPLTSIKAYAETLIDMAEEESIEKEFLTIINEETDRLNILINDILDLSKIEAGKMEFRIEINDINAIIKRAVKNMESFASKKDIIIKTEFQDEKCEIPFDKDRILQVLLNLINNAVKFSNENSEIKVFCKHYSDKYVLIGVKDSGVGIAKEHFETVFEKFKQTDNVLKRNVGGTGLGLPICKNIIEYHGGRIWVESEIGKGATFLFTIPKI